VTCAFVPPRSQRPHLRARLDRLSPRPACSAHRTHHSLTKPSDSAGATDGAHGLAPTRAQLCVAAASRRVRVYAYDLAAAGVQPPLAATAAGSRACACGHHFTYADSIAPLDLCNHGLGKLYRPRFAAPYQGVYWGNHDLGGSLATAMHARLQASDRRVTDPARADLFFIPLESRHTCATSTGFRGDEARGYFERCGYDYRDRAQRTIPDMWKWLLTQPSFRDSDGSDHFVIIEPAGWHQGPEPLVRPAPVMVFLLR
jgi:hypothetical protein